MYNFFYCTYSFGRFFHGSGFSGSDSDFLADPDPDLGKKFDPDPDKRIRIQNTAFYIVKKNVHWICPMLHIIIRGRIGRRRRWTLSWAWLGGRRSWGWTWPGGGMMARAPSTSQPYTRYYRQLSGDLCVTFSDVIVEPFHFHPAPASQDPSSGYVVHNFLLLGLFYSQLGTSSFLCSSSTSLTGIDKFIPWLLQVLFYFFSLNVTAGQSWCSSQKGSSAPRAPFITIF